MNSINSFGTPRGFTFVVIAAVCACAAASSAHAQTWYGGLDGGSSRSSFDCSDTLRCDRNSTTARLNLGYRIGPLFGVQAGLIDNRGASGDVAVSDTETLRVKIKSQGFELAGLVHTPQASGWSGYANLGISSMKATSTAEFAGVGQSVSGRKTAPVLGLGVFWQPWSEVSLHAGFDTRRLAVEEETFNQRAFVLGARFTF